MKDHGASLAAVAGSTSLWYPYAIKKRLSKNLAIALLSTLGSLGLAEALVRSLDLFPDERAATRAQASAGEAKQTPQARYLIHPFLGYSGNPAYAPGQFDLVPIGELFPDGPSPYYQRNSRTQTHGFASEHADYAADPDGFHVGIFGGSVAELLATAGGEALIAELERRAPELRGRVRIVNGAIGGYKQPQQLIALILMTLQGVRFDAIVNVDGFNEVSLSSFDAAEHYNPLFPSRSHYLLMLGGAREAGSAGVIERMAEVIQTRRRAREWRETADRGLLAGSELVRALLGRASLRADARATRLEQELQQQASAPPSLAAYEPACLSDPGNACWDLIADIWETSSLEMAAIAARIGARYVHVLQPNQYVDGSKPLSEREREIAYAPESPWPTGVRRGYPLLRARIPGMLARGVAVHDLTQLFAGDVGDVYIDVCCHYNLRGTSALAAAIADRILSPESAASGDGS